MTRLTKARRMLVIGIVFVSRGASAQSRGDIIDPFLETPGGQAPSLLDPFVDRPRRVLRSRELIDPFAPGRRGTVDLIDPWA